MEPVGKAAKSEVIVVPYGSEAGPSNPERTVANLGKKNVDIVVKELCKRSLQNAASIRQINAALFNQAILPDSRQCISKSIAAGQSYNIQTKALGKGHGLGSPHATSSCVSSG